MTIEELYEQIGGDYEQAKRVLRMDKLIDKHIRKLATNGIIEALIAAASGERTKSELFGMGADEFVIWDIGTTA